MAKAKNGIPQVQVQAMRMGGAFLAHFGIEYRFERFEELREHTRRGHLIQFSTDLPLKKVRAKMRKLGAVNKVTSPSGLSQIGLPQRISFQFEDGSEGCLSFGETFHLVRGKTVTLIRFTSMR